MTDFSKALYLLLGERIRTLRINKNLSQEELSKNISELGRTSISNIEKGKQAPSLSTIYKIFNALGSEVHFNLPTFNEIEEKASSSNNKFEKELNELDVDNELKSFISQLSKK